MLYLLRRAMVRVRIAGEIPHRDVPVRGPLDLEGTVVPARREYAAGITIDEQAQHHVQQILGATRSLHVHFNEGRFMPSTAWMTKCTKSKLIHRLCR